MDNISKGERTRKAILDAAVVLASVRGFEALSIGTLAERVGISKSGLFGHFSSREALQIAAIEAAAGRFAGRVYRPALAALMETGSAGSSAVAGTAGAPWRARYTNSRTSPGRSATKRK